MKKTWSVLSINWLIRLRWFAIGFVILATFFAKNILYISIQAKEIYLIDGILLALNTFYYLFLNRIDRIKLSSFTKATNFILNFQISTDYLILTALMHFSGGTDNPFIIVYLFHMILAGIMLPLRHSLLQATLALLLVGTMGFLEFTDVIPHHSLEGFISRSHPNDNKYIILTSLIFVSASYSIVYMTNYVTGNLRLFEKANRIANAELNRKDKIKNDFVLKLTHDIKGHIYAIQTMLSVLRSKMLGSLEPKQEEFVNRAYNRTKTLSDFTKDLLSHTQMLMSRELKKESFSLRDTVKKVMHTYSNNAQRKSITINFSMDDTLEKIDGNQLSIEALLSNLLFNAIKYTPEKGMVSLIISDKNKNVLIEVSDNGIGIAEDDQSKIFDEFYRAQNAKKLDTDGTGMGLSIASQVVKIHKGKIWMESILNEGTTFWVRIPKKH